MKRNSAEYSLQVFAVQLLSLSAAPGVVFFHVPNQRASGPRTGAFLKKMGVRAGVSDLCLVLPGGQFAGLELKASKGTVSPEQRRFRESIEAVGGKYAVAKTPEAVSEILHQWGAVK